jgi:1,2-diacylglycerol 3-beta-galactosyltransferase
MGDGGCMSEKKRILILTIDAGFGHRSAANAVRDAILDQFSDCCEPLVINPLDEDRAFLLRRLGQDDYDRLVKYIPQDLYKFGYDVIRTKSLTAITTTSTVVLLYDLMRLMVEKFKPHAILATNPLYQAPLLEHFDTTGIHPPLFNVVTDMASAQRLWFNKRLNGICVPNQATRDLALQYGVIDRRLHLTGIPVSPSIFKETRPPQDIRRELGLEAEKMTILAVGSIRVFNLLPSLEAVNGSELPVQVIAVAGKNEKLFAGLKGINWKIPVVIKNYADNMPTLMRASDLVMSKAGGLIVTESLAAGLPLLLCEVIEGQESGNADFILSHGAAELASDPADLVKVLGRWLAEGGKLLEERKRNACEIGLPQAAYTVAGLLEKAAERGPFIGKSRSRRIQQRVEDILSESEVYNWLFHDREE